MKNFCVSNFNCFLWLVEEGLRVPAHQNHVRKFQSNSLPKKHHPIILQVYILRALSHRDTLTHTREVKSGGKLGEGRGGRFEWMLPVFTLTWVNKNFGWIYSPPTHKWGFFSFSYAVVRIPHSVKPNTISHWFYHLYFLPWCQNGAGWLYIITKKS